MQKVWIPAPGAGFVRAEIVEPDSSAASSEKVWVRADGPIGADGGNDENENDSDSQSFEVLRSDIVARGAMDDDWLALQQTSNLAQLENLTGPLLLEALRVRCGYDFDGVSSAGRGEESDHVTRACARVYSRVGSVLVSVNPYGYVGADIYSESVMQSMLGLRLHESPHPHVFALAAGAFAALRDSAAQENQAIVVTGESGSGKTEATKQILQFLTFATTSQEVAPADSPAASLQRSRAIAGSLEQRLLLTSPVLEAFGNGKTVRNDNSSRFGKFVRILFEPAGANSLRIHGAHIDHYLLEKSRIVHQQAGERNYHIFYLLLAGCAADKTLAARLQLTSDARMYHFLNQGGPESEALQEADETNGFYELQESLRCIHIDDTSQLAVFTLLSALLHLGNLCFEASGHGDGCKLSSQSHVHIAAVSSLLACERAHLETVLVKREFHSQGRKSFYSVPLTAGQAAESRDALVKFAYSALFDWIVRRANDSIAGRKVVGMSYGGISVLDIFGFECFQVNSFEQLCINFCNEKLQQQFVQVMMREEQEVYRRELIAGDVPEVNFRDNEEVVSLIEARPSGVLATLDEECRLPRGTNRGFLEKLEHQFGGSGKGASGTFQARQTTASASSSQSDSAFIHERTRPGCFSIQHYAGRVTYDVTGWLDKNRDTLSPDLADLIQTRCGLPLLRMVFDFAVKQTDRGSRMSSATVSSQFRAQLSALVTDLGGCFLHYVRCIKPNAAKVSCNFDGEFVLQQLRYIGLLETTRLRRAGFLYRKPFGSFVAHFGCLLVPPASAVDADGRCMEGDPMSLLNQQQAIHDSRTLSEQILALVATNVHQDFALGRTLVFLRDSAVSDLERQRWEWRAEVERACEVVLHAKREARRQRVFETVQELILEASNQNVIVRANSEDMRAAVSTACLVAAEPRVCNASCDNVSTSVLSLVQQATTDLLTAQRRCDPVAARALTASAQALDAARSAIEGYLDFEQILSDAMQQASEVRLTWDAVQAERVAALGSLQSAAASVQQLLDEQCTLREEEAHCAEQIAAEEMNCVVQVAAGDTDGTIQHEQARARSVPIHTGSKGEEETYGSLKAVRMALQTSHIQENSTASVRQSLARRVQDEEQVHRRQLAELERKQLNQAAEAAISLPTYRTAAADVEPHQKWGWIGRRRQVSPHDAQAPSSPQLFRTETESLLAGSRRTYFQQYRAQSTQDLRGDFASVRPNSTLDSDQLRTQLDAVNSKIASFQTQYDAIQKMKVVYAAGGSAAHTTDEEDLLRAKIEALEQGRSMIEMQLAEDSSKFARASSSGFASLTPTASGGEGDIKPLHLSVQDYDVATPQGKRNAILVEIVQTERDYIRDLDTLLSVFMTPMKLHKLVDTATLHSIFSNITEINKVNKQFLRDLSAAVAEVQRGFNGNQDEGGEAAAAIEAMRFADPRASFTSTAVKSLGEIMVRMSAFFRVYKLYSANYESAIALIQRLKARNRDFVLFLEKAEADPRCKQLNLGAYLIKPVQRVCKYPLLLRELIRNTSQEEKPSEYAALMTAADKIDSIVADVNEGRRQAEAMAHIIQIQERIEGISADNSLVAPARLLVREGQLRFSAYENVKRHKPVEHQVFLFNDLLVVCRRKGFSLGSVVARRSEESNGPEFILKVQVPLDMRTRVIMCSSEAEKSTLHGAFQLQQTTADGKHTTVTLAPLLVGDENSVAECRSWLEDVRRLHKDQQRKAALGLQGAAAYSRTCSPLVSGYSSAAFQLQ